LLYHGKWFQNYNSRFDSALSSPGAVGSPVTPSDARFGGCEIAVDQFYDGEERTFEKETCENANNNTDFEIYEDAPSSDERENTEKNAGLREDFQKDVDDDEMDKENRPPINDLKSAAEDQRREIGEAKEANEEASNLDVSASNADTYSDKFEDENDESELGGEDVGDDMADDMENESVDDMENDNIENDLENDRPRPIRSYDIEEKEAEIIALQAKLEAAEIALEWEKEERMRVGKINSNGSSNDSNDMEKMEKVNSTGTEKNRSMEKNNSMEKINSLESSESRPQPMRSYEKEEREAELIALQAKLEEAEMALELEREERMRVGGIDHLTLTYDWNWNERMRVGGIDHLTTYDGLRI
jgi:hypothetical protein